MAFTTQTSFVTHPPVFHRSRIHSYSYPPPSTKWRYGGKDGDTPMGRLYMNWFSDKIDAIDESTAVTTTVDNQRNREIVIGDPIGSGSYGTVHYCTFEKTNDEATASSPSAATTYIAKRSWTFNELLSKQEAMPKSKQDSYDVVKDRAKRCNYFIHVEQHCLEKVKTATKAQSSQLPRLVGRFMDTSKDKREWLVFEPIARYQDEEGEPRNDLTVAKTLKDVMDLDWRDQHRDLQQKKDEEDSDHRHHLFMIQKELGLPDSATFEDTLDVVMKELLNVLVKIHKLNIVHRDVKPENLLVDGNTQSFVLIDFGSAADIDPVKAKNIFSFGSRVGLEDDSRTAVSPIYAAPETFVKWDKSPLEFDVFSVGLIFCQLLFNLLDERTDAAFRQQLLDSNCDLDIWLESSLAATFRPALDEGLSYLADRPGTWSLLKEMLVANPTRRIPSKEAVDRFEAILSNVREGKEVSREDIDGSYFDGVVASLDTCVVSEDVPQNNLIPRPLHFVATFKRQESLGLLLSEVDEEEEYDEKLSEDEQKQWDLATFGSSKGDVFIRGIVKGGQASEMNIFEIGDKIVGVSDFPLSGGGFEEVLSLLQRVPQRSNTVKIHFDRKLTNNPKPKKEKLATKMQISSQGAWSTRGRRKMQEDRFLLHEVSTKEEKVLLAGIFDGHGGSAAAETAAQLMPSLYRSELESNNGRQGYDSALEAAWDSVCDAYREGCSIYGACVADYDPREGILFARTGAKDLVAGTTSALIAMPLTNDEEKDDLVIMNCGDSRILLVGKADENSKDSLVHFVTRDHSPRDKDEAKRLRKGKKDGLDYSQPECSVNRWWIKVGDYQYAVCRSLEGTYATSKGIISKPDITSFNLSEVSRERSLISVIAGSDGLFEALDNQEVSHYVLEMRSQGLSANDVARRLCEIAIEKESLDNVSAVVIFLE